VDIAKRTMAGIVDEHLTAFQFLDYEINRMLVCGACERSGIDPQESRAAWRQAIGPLMESVDRYDEWGRDPVIITKRRSAAAKRYRTVHDSDLRAKSADRRIKARIAKLQEELSHG